MLKPLKLSIILLKLLNYTVKPINILQIIRIVKNGSC